jgi:hypothetical protein
MVRHALPRERTLKPILGPAAQNETAVA